MLNFVQIYKKDRATLTGHASSARGRHMRRAVIVTLVLLLCAFFSDLSMDFLAAVLAFQSILAGFGFNVLVFLTSNRRIPTFLSMKIEKKKKIDRVNALGNDLFYNISYFNTVAISCVAAALIISIGKSVSFDFVVELPRNDALTMERLNNISQYGSILVRKVSAACLYALLIESVLTFMRLIRRSTYYFEQKIALSHDVTDD